MLTEPSTTPSAGWRPGARAGSRRAARGVHTEDGTGAIQSAAERSQGAGETGALSFEQGTVLAAIDAFIRAPAGRRVFSVHGLAGTGKSHLLAHVARRYPEALVCTPTGKAAAVLRERFGLPARTVHSMFHRLTGETQGAEGRRDLTFEPRRRDGSLSGRILLVDECSMVTAQMVGELLRTGVRIVAFGDPGQLPPVNGEASFPRAGGVTLHTIHRQALGSPLIRQAHRVRDGLDYQPDGDAFRVVPRGTVDDLRRADVVLCWRNVTRQFLNQHCRYVRGVVPMPAQRDGSFDPRVACPRQWEPVVVLRNAPRFDLWNGDVETLNEDVRPGDTTVSFFRVAESGDSAGGVIFPLASFEGVPGAGGARDGLELAFSYCRTVHKAQGSEWPNVLIYDEFPPDDPERSRWLYTALTRASERIVIVNRYK